MPSQPLQPGFCLCVALMLCLLVCMCKTMNEKFTPWLGDTPQLQEIEGPMSYGNHGVGNSRDLQSLDQMFLNSY